MPLQRKLGLSRPGISGVEFMMMTPDGTSVPCNLTRDALGMLFKGPGGIAVVGQLAVFDQYRDKIEAVAGQKWDCSQLEEGRVIVTPEDLVKAALA